MPVMARHHLLRPHQQLLAQRSICFEAVVVVIETGGLLDVLAHPNPERFGGQRILAVAVNQYVYLVPYVEDGDHLFLKTISPSHKATRDYLRQDTP